MTTIKLMITAILVAMAGAAFVDFLDDLQGHHSFERLSEEEKLLFGGLVVAAENDELQQFIDRMGLIPVLKLMDRELTLSLLLLVVLESSLSQLMMRLLLLLL